MASASDSGNRIFVPFKALGQVCGDVPFAYRAKGGGTHRQAVILVPLGTVVLQVRLFYCC